MERSVKVLLGVVPRYRGEVLIGWLRRFCRKGIVTVVVGAVAGDDVVGAAPAPTFGAG